MIKQLQKLKKQKQFANLNWGNKHNYSIKLHQACSQEVVERRGHPPKFSENWQNCTLFNYPVFKKD